jgi:hypothetical protein
MKNVLPDRLALYTVPRTHVVSFMCASASVQAMHDDDDVDADAVDCACNVGFGVAVLMGRATN